MSDVYSVTICAPGTLIGATVSALVYTSLITTGEIAAAVTGTGIELTGNALAYGAELVTGSHAATSIRTLAKSYGAIAKPAISNTSRLGALGISVLAGTGAAVTTSALLYGASSAGHYIYDCYVSTKKKLAENVKIEDYIAGKIQKPVESSNEILLIEDDIQLIQDVSELKPITASPINL